MPVSPAVPPLYCPCNNNGQHALRAVGMPLRASLSLLGAVPAPGGCTRQRAVNSTGKKRYRVRLDDDERRRLRGMVDGGKGSKERRLRAHALLLADENRAGGGHRDASIADVLGIGTATVERVRRQCVTEGLEAALARKVQVSRKKRLLDGDGEAKLVMLACSEPPEGQAH